MSVGNPTADTQAKQKRFLIAYAELGVISKAASAAKISSVTVYKWRKYDIMFLEKMNEAQQSHNDKLEGMLFDLVGEMHKNLDYKANPTLLIFALNGAMPTKYKGASAPASDAKDLIADFRKAYRASLSEPEQKEEPVVETKSAVEQASEIIESKRGSLNDRDKD
jgi:hypothetical protein